MTAAQTFLGVSGLGPAGIVSFCCAMERRGTREKGTESLLFDLLDTFASGYWKLLVRLILGKWVVFCIYCSVRVDFWIICWKPRAQCVMRCAIFFVLAVCCLFKCIEHRGLFPLIGSNGIFPVLSSHLISFISFVRRQHITYHSEVAVL